MTSRVLKKQSSLRFDRLLEAIRAEPFWRGFAEGLAPQNFIFTGCNVTRLLGKDDSVYDSWQEVGSLLTDAIKDYGHVEAAEAKSERRIRPA